jgi:hypothetical protein
LGCDGVQGWIGGGGRRKVVLAMGGGALVFRQGREVAVVVRDAAGNGAGLLIAGVRWFEGDIPPATSGGSVGRGRGGQSQVR